MVVTGQRVQTLNQSVLFVNDTDFLYTRDAWRVVVEIDLSAYHETISEIRTDMMIIEQQKQEFTPVSELKHVESLLETLDARLSDFQQVLPRLDPRRGLLDLGGLVLKQMFETATVSDIHEVLDELRQNSGIVHSVSDQLSYVKNLGKINAEAIANLSNVVKEQMIQSHDQLLNLAKDMF